MLCCISLLCLSSSSVLLPVFLECQFLIAPSVFSNIYISLLIPMSVIHVTFASIFCNISFPGVPSGINSRYITAYNLTNSVGGLASIGVYRRFVFQSFQAKHY